MEKEKEKEFIIGLMEIDMKEILRMIKEKGKVFTIGMMEIDQWEIIKMIKKLDYM